MKKHKPLTTSDIESALATYFDPRKNIVVPNISWGAGLHECDILVIRKNGHLVEVEIKISKADLKKDLLKGHAHKSERIKELYYCVTESLQELAIEILPEHVGILVCQQSEGGHIYIQQVRSNTPQHQYRVATDEEKLNIARLGCLRIWNLKHKLNELNRTDQASQLKELNKRFKALLKNNHEGNRDMITMLWKVRERLQSGNLFKDEADRKELDEQIMQILIKNS